MINFYVVSAKAKIIFSFHKNSQFGVGSVLFSSQFAVVGYCRVLKLDYKLSGKLSLVKWKM